MTARSSALAELIGPSVAGVEIRPSVARGGDRSLVDDSLLFDEERALVASVAPARYHDFVLGRRCARLAIEALGLRPQPILVGERREPRWPRGLVGAITHTDGYVAAAVAHSEAVWSIGLDAEADDRLPEGVERRIIRPDEQHLLAPSDAGVAAVDRLIFSAKEAVYKAWFPLTGQWLGFLDARLELDTAAQRFVAHLTVDPPMIDGRLLHAFEGRYASVGGIIVTAVEVPAPR